jgi:hypothetical protein
VLIPLVLSAFLHIWNPFGFPGIHGDEAHYMRRTMNVLEGFGPQGSNTTMASLFDHPYFGQIFLASALTILDYPDLLAPFHTDFADIVQSIERLYSIPRIIMGSLAVQDTLLIYKICERRYDKRMAFIASILFAVMPIGWLSERIVLDSIMLPFILFAIYFALCQFKVNINLPTSAGKRALIQDSDARIIIVLLSGIFLGLAIFTKIPAFTFIPLVGFLVFTNSNKSLKMLGMWFIPVILIPMLWPLYSALGGNFEAWWEGVVWQAGREGRGILRSIIPIFESDPVLFLLGFIGIVYATSRKDLFPVIWLGPFILFHYFVPFIQHFHWITLIPLLCIAGGYLIVQLLDSLKERIFWQSKKYHLNWQYAPFVIVVTIVAVFGVFSSIALINIDANSTLFEVNARLVQLLLPFRDEYFGNPGDKPLIMGSDWTQILTWIPEHIYDISYNFRTFTIKNLDSAGQSSYVVLLGDMRNKERYTIVEDLSAKDLELFQYYNRTHAVLETKDESDISRYNADRYPFGSLRENHAIKNGDWIEIRTREN